MADVCGFIVALRARDHPVIACNCKAEDWIGLGPKRGQSSAADLVRPVAGQAPIAPSGRGRLDRKHSFDFYRFNPLVPDGLEECPIVTLRLIAVLDRKLADRVVKAAAGAHVARDHRSIT